jgi:hypothetical protein
MYGYFAIPALYFVCDALSGGWGKGPLPDGRYRCSNLRTRKEHAMVRDGVGFSVVLSDMPGRKLLRIHPDGGVPGTLGCIGITSDVRACYEALKEQMGDGRPRWLKVVAVTPPKLKLYSHHHRRARNH